MTYPVDTEANSRPGDGGILKSSHNGSILSRIREGVRAFLRKLKANNHFEGRGLASCMLVIASKSLMYYP